MVTLSVIQLQNNISMLFNIGIFILLISLTFSLILYYFTKIFNYQFFEKNYSSIYYIRFLLVTSLIVSFFCYCYVFFFYLQFLSEKIGASLIQPHLLLQSTLNTEQSYMFNTYNTNSFL